MKIAMYCDSLYGRGGQTRVQIELANYLNADIITSGYDPKIKKWLPINNKVIDIGNITYKYSQAFSYYFEAPLRFIFCTDYKYDVYIFNGTSSIFASKKGRKNIWLCYSPNRLLHDLKEWKLMNSGFFKRVFFHLHIFLFELLDRKVIRNNFEDIVAISKTVKKRIKKYYDLDAQVIYPPINRSKYRFSKFGDYYLAVSRLMPEKRMDLVASIFTKIRNKRLILVGDGVEKNKIEEIIKDSRNIKLLTKVNDNELVDLYSNCLAVIYLPKDEDYGLVPLEAMASGKICIAVNEGGCLETVVNNKTGYLVDPSEESIIRAIKKVDNSKLDLMKKYCISQASRFTEDISNKQWDKIMEKYKSN